MSQTKLYPTSLPPRKLQLHHRLILLNSGALTQMGWAFLGLGSFFTLIFGIMASTGALENSELLSVLIAIAFPLLGLLLLFASLKRNFKTVDLLINGKFAKGKVSNKSATNVSINNQAQYEYTVRFQADDQKTYEVKGKTHLAARVSDEAEERVLYWPNDPQWGTIYDTIPDAPAFTSDGQIIAPHWSRLGVLILPTLGTLSFLGLIYVAIAGLRILLEI